MTRRVHSMATPHGSTVRFTANQGAEVGVSRDPNPAKGLKHSYPHIHSCATGRILCRAPVRTAPAYIWLTDEEERRYLLGQRNLQISGDAKHVMILLETFENVKSHTVGQSCANGTPNCSAPTRMPQLCIAGRWTRWKWPDRQHQDKNMSGSQVTSNRLAQRWSGQGAN